MEDLPSPGRASRPIIFQGREMSEPKLIYSTGTDDATAAVFENAPGNFIVIAWAKAEDYEKDFLEKSFENSEEAIDFAENYVVAVETQT